MPQLTLEELVARSESGYPQNVRKAVLTGLFEDGTLTGTRDGKRIDFDDTPALRRVLGLGVEDFVYNTQGWCFFAVEAPIERVAEVMARHRFAERYEPSVAVRPSGEDLGIAPSPTRRDAFAIDCPPSPWTAIVQTVHWFQGSDPPLAIALAADLSEALGCRGAAMWDDDFSGTHLVTLDRGQRGAYLGDESGDWEDVQLEVYRLGLRVPKCFIASDDEGGGATLHVADPAEVRRADHVVLRMPESQQVRVPHVFEKLGLMAGAIAEPPDDEGDFCDQMIDAIWRQATALRSAP